MDVDSIYENCDPNIDVAGAAQTILQTMQSLGLDSKFEHITTELGDNYSVSG